MKNRIYQIMKHEGLNQKEFSMKTGISPATLSSIFNGRQGASLNTVEILHTIFPKLNMSWLMFGEGEMFSEQDTNVQVGPNPSSASVDGDLFGSYPADSNEGGDSQNLQFELAGGDKTQPVVREVVKYIDKPQRRITEIRIFFDDGTFETFPGK